MAYYCESGLEKDIGLISCVSQGLVSVYVMLWMYVTSLYDNVCWIALVVLRAPFMVGFCLSRASLFLVAHIGCMSLGFVCLLLVLGFTQMADVPDRFYCVV